MLQQMNVAKNVFSAVKIWKQDKPSELVPEKNNHSPTSFLCGYYMQYLQLISCIFYSPQHPPCLVNGSESL